MEKLSGIVLGGLFLIGVAGSGLRKFEMFPFNNKKKKVCPVPECHDCVIETAAQMKIIVPQINDMHKWMMDKKNPE